jgi:hypothetical protein
MSTETLYGHHAALHTTAESAVNELRISINMPEGWIELCLLILFLLSFHYIRWFLNTSLPGLIHFHVAQKQFEENMLIVAHTRYVSLLLSLASVAFFIFLLIRYYGYLPSHLPSVLVYVIIMTSLWVFYVVKSALLRTVGFFSKTEIPLKMIDYYGQLYTITAGICLFPMVTLFFNQHTSWCNVLSIIGVSFLLMLVFMYVIRSLRIFIVSGISLFFWFLYLCTFEVAPFLLLYKYIIST